MGVSEEMGEQGVDKEGEGVKVFLGEVTPSEQYLKWLADPEVTYFLEGAGNYTMEQLQEYVEARKKDSFFFGIYVINGNETLSNRPIHIGNVKAGPINWRHKHADVGIMIGEKRFHGQGIGTEAINLLVAHCFGQGLHMLTCGIIENNIASRKAFTKAWFEEAGVWDEFRWLPSEGWKSEYFYQRLRSE